MSPRVKSFANGGKVYPADLNTIEDDYEAQDLAIAKAVGVNLDGVVRRAKSVNPGTIDVVGGLALDASFGGTGQITLSTVDTVALNCETDALVTILYEALYRLIIPSDWNSQDVSNVMATTGLCTFVLGVAATSFGPQKPSGGSAPQMLGQGTPASSNYIGMGTLHGASNPGAARLSLPGHTLWSFSDPDTDPALQNMTFAATRVIEGKQVKLIVPAGTQSISIQAAAANTRPSLPGTPRPVTLRMKTRTLLAYAESF